MPATGWPSFAIRRTLSTSSGLTVSRPPLPSSLPILVDRLAAVFRLILALHPAPLPRTEPGRSAEVKIGPFSMGARYEIACYLGRRNRPVFTLGSLSLCQ
jgi:hypothetical protein